jgi:hypothetical protein
VKTTLGLYNDSQDLDFLHVFALLPQGVYPADMRDTTIAHRGGDVYGNFPLPHRLGEFGYTAYAGYQNSSIYSGYPYLATQYGAFFREVPGSQYGADLRWSTPLKGLMMGASRMNQEVTGKGQYRNDLYLPTGPITYQLSTKVYWTNQFYGEYMWQKLRVDAEYRRYFVLYPILPGSDVSTDVRAWYVAGSYRVWKHVEVGSYYSRYTILSKCGGFAAAFIPPQTDSSLPQNHVYDKVLAARLDVNRFFYLKLEGHFMNGYGLGPYPDGFYPQQNPTGFKANTAAFVIKTGFRF